MSTAELKVSLIKTITDLEDVELLKQIPSVIHANDSKILSFTATEKNVIVRAREQFKNGDFLDHEAAEKDIEEWLS